MSVERPKTHPTNELYNELKYKELVKPTKEIKFTGKQKLRTRSLNFNLNKLKKIKHQSYKASNLFIKSEAIILEDC